MKKITFLLGFLCTALCSTAQVLIKGVVQDPRGVPVEAASITLKGTNVGVQSDLKGSFSIQARPGDMLVVSAVGFVTQNLTIHTETSVTITLKESDSRMEGVVVIGYQKITRKKTTAAISSISGKEIEGNKAYTNLMDTLFWRTYEFLYDKEEHLYYRDSRYMTEKEANGAKKFWGRGNGWVLAGLARLLEIAPKDFPNRARYEQLFKDMAAKIASLQQPDGMWRASLLDPASYPGKETSGTGFYCYAMAWGINNKLLDKATYYPVVQKAWIALNECVHPHGKLGFVQRIADKPGVTSYEDTDAFGVGGFLLSGTEILKMKK